jgi:uncharacterized protein YaiE (UPF0345 family)
MSTTDSARIEVVSVVKQANVYFDGRCVSHSLVLADGTKKSVGVILPASLSFTTAAPEVMETVAGSCRYRLPGGDWAAVHAGESFSVPANTRFEIEVSGEPYHYVCHFD